MFRFITLFLAFLSSGCAPSGTYTRYGVSHYRGDGVIRDVSQCAWPFSSHGFVIELDQFDLGNALDKQFHLADVPTIAGSHVEIALAVEDEEISRLGIRSVDSLRRQLRANVSFELLDSTNGLVTALSTNIGSFVWSGPVHGYNGFWLYIEPGSFFTPRAGERYFLHVRYSPDASLRGKQGRIYLDSLYGGS